MPTVSALMAAGMPPAQANMLGTGPATGATPAGASQGTATQLTSPTTTLGTASAAGVILPSAAGQPTYVVYNNSGNAQNVYPAVGETINALTANTAVSVPSAKAASFEPSGHKSWFANISA
jgi:hypothetical protein